jgi:CHAT domain
LLEILAVDTKTFELKWDKTKDNLSLTFIRDGKSDSYSADAKLIAAIPQLPQAIASDEPIASIADHYRDVLGGFRRPGTNALNAFSEVLGARFYGLVKLRLTASAPALGLLGLSWELLLHDSNPELLREKLGSVALVRSLQKTSDYSPDKIDAAFRVLLLQGAPGDPPLDFEVERKALEGAWTSLGALLSDRIARPKIIAGDLRNLAEQLITEKPHLLWFSGHGRQKNKDFQLLFPNGSGAEWHSVSALSQAVEEARRQSHHVPLVAAFWACDGTRTPAGPPSLDAASAGFPILVDKMLGCGIEAVLGVQTQVYDSTARTMGESFFRAIAEGRGPAAALAAARVDLYRNPSRFAPGSQSEWTSPVLWTNGADLLRITWAAALEENEAIVFHRLGRESLLEFEGGRDIFSERPDLSAVSAARGWCQDAPIWITSHDFARARQLSVIRDLRQLVLTERKTVLLIRYNSISDQSLLDAIARSFRELKSRIFPTPSDDAIDVLVALFQAFSSGNRSDAWRRLLQQSELVITIFAEGGMIVDDDLAAVTSSSAKVIVVSNREAGNFDGKPFPLSGWKADDLPGEALPPNPDEPTAAFLAALALLDKPLAKDAIALFARDFGLDAVDSVLRDFMIRFGTRYVVKASIARLLDERLKDDERRAAHRACMNFLERVPNTFDADPPTQLAWRLSHALKAREFEVALPLAEDAIHRGADVGRHDFVVGVYKELGAVRKDLPVGAKLEVAFAQIQTGHAQSAYDLIRQIPPQSLENRTERLCFAVRQAEALRNLHDRTKHAQSIEVLEKASQTFPTKGWSVQEKRWWLAARQDLARNLHYFGGDVLKVRDIFRDVVERCADNPVFAYIKAAALRNLSDIYNKYGYGRIKTDKNLAATYLGQAIAIADNPSLNVHPLLPEFLYLSAKLDYSEGHIADAGGALRRAIDLARSGGLARILGLSNNKLFWWNVGSLTTERCQKFFEFSKWQRIDDQLDLLSQDPWVARALVTSRLHAAKCLDLLSNKVAAIEVLKHAQTQLEESSLFEGEADFRGRWQPVFAGLALLNAAPEKSSPHQAHEYDEKVWGELRVVGERIQGTKDFQIPEPQQVWKGVA